MTCTFKIDCHSPLPSRNLDRFDHYPLHFRSAHERPQENAKLNRTEFQKLHHFGEIFRRQGLLVRIEAGLSKSAKPHLSADATRPAFQPATG
jgi:hypothetical protein